MTFCEALEKLRFVIFIDYINPSYGIFFVKKNLTAFLRMHECVKQEKQQNFLACSLFYTVE